MESLEMEYGSYVSREEMIEFEDLCLDKVKEFVTSSE